jgi:uncharacterized membrane protein YeaQ/YmgE (transglycosylase-associated protein family)
MNISLNFTTPSPVQLLVYLLIALIAGLVVGGLARMRSGFGYFVTIILAAVGAWLFVSFLNLEAARDISIADVPLIVAFIGALIFALVSVILFRPRHVVEVG